MTYVLVFINAVVVALMAMYVYEYERRIGEISARHNRTDKEIDVLKIKAKSKENRITELEQLLSTKAETEKLTELENQQIVCKRNLTEVENQLNSGTRKLTVVENQLLKSNEKVLALEKKFVDEIKDTKQLLSTKAEIQKLAEIENQQLESKKKGVTYIRWGKTQCDGSGTETIYSGQVGGCNFQHTGASVNYICLPNNPDVAQPLKLHDYYAYLYGAEYEIFDVNQPQGFRSGITDHDVACAACLVKGKISSIMIPGRKTCYNGWTKEYEGILMAGYHSHQAASEFACVDRDTEAMAGGSNNENGKLFYPVKTVCGSLKCPPYVADTEVLCVVCSK